MPSNSNVLEDLIAFPIKAISFSMHLFLVKYGRLGAKLSRRSGLVVSYE